MGIKNHEVFEQDFIEICNVLATALAQAVAELADNHHKTDSAVLDNPE
jgi:hypothetical protein